MCYLQRIAVIGLGLVFLAAAVHDPAAPGARIYALVVAVVAAAGVAVAVRHIWMSMQPPGSLPSCGADFYTMVEMLPFTQVVAKIWNGGGECQIIQWRLRLFAPAEPRLGVEALSRLFSKHPPLSGGAGEGGAQ